MGRRNLLEDNVVQKCYGICNENWSSDTSASLKKGKTVQQKHCLPYKNTETENETLHGPEKQQTYSCTSVHKACECCQIRIKD
jgi:hypothetical protein